MGQNFANGWVKIGDSEHTILYAISEEEEIGAKSIEAGADKVFNNLGRPLYDTVFQYFDNNALETDIAVMPTKILKYKRDVKFEAVSINNNNADFELRNKSENP